MFVSVSVFATNLTERNVYGILSENFTGATETNGRSEDNIRKYCGSTYGEWKAAAAVEISSAPTVAKEGKNYWEIVLEKWDRVATEHPNDYWTAVAFYFVGSDNTTERPKNVNHFKYLDFWVKPKTGDITKVLVGMTTINSADSCVSLGSLGVTNNDTWQRVTVDITTLPNINLTNIKNCLTIKGNNSLSGNTAFYIDNVVLRTNNSSASFKATLKKVETEPWAPENPTQLTWDEEAISFARKNEGVSPWWPCGQYIELDMDMYSYSWTVRVYSNNGASGRGGMYATVGSKDYTVPMCWRAYNGTLIDQPGNDTYLIAEVEKEDENGNKYRALYDDGKSAVDPNYYPWFHMKDIADIENPNNYDSLESGSITVWKSSLGYHGFSTKDQWDGFYAFMERVTDEWYRPSVEKKPKLYFGGRFGDAGGGVTYTGNIVIELNYE